jgi:hypothetical protein
MTARRRAAATPDAAAASGLHARVREVADQLNEWAGNIRSGQLAESAVHVSRAEGYELAARRLRRVLDDADAAEPDGTAPEVASDPDVQVVTRPDGFELRADAGLPVAQLNTTPATCIPGRASSGTLVDDVSTYRRTASPPSRTLGREHHGSSLTGVAIISIAGVAVAAHVRWPRTTARAHASPVNVPASPSAPRHQGRAGHPGGRPHAPAEGPERI